MNIEKIYDENNLGFIQVCSLDKVECVNPIDYYKACELEEMIILLRDKLNAKNPFLASLLDDDFFIKEAEKGLIGFFDQFEKTKIHDNLLQLLKTTRKKDQEHLLKKGMTISIDEFMSLIFKSYNDFGFLYSRYLFETLPSGLEGKIFPRLLYLKDDGSVEKVGKTDLTDVELKRVIEYRKVIVSHFFEKDDFWHCFFLTYKSIGGGESWKNGQAHFHYISSSFGISKADFVESMRIGNYKSTSIHIGLLGYGNQTGV